MGFGSWLLVALGVLLSSLGSVFLKLGAVRLDHDHGFVNALLGAVTEWRLYVGVICYVVPVVLWIYLLKRIDITYLQPLFSMVYVITPVVAIYFLHEAMPLSRWFGIFFILVGIAISAQH